MRPRAEAAEPTHGAHFVFVLCTVTCFNGTPSTCRSAWFSASAATWLGMRMPPRVTGHGRQLDRRRRPHIFDGAHLGLDRHALHAHRPARFELVVARRIAAMLSPGSSTTFSNLTSVISIWPAIPAMPSNIEVSKRA